MALFQSLPGGSGKYLTGRLPGTAKNPPSIIQAVTDGDTIKVALAANQGLRLLGCDTPEKSIEFPGRPMNFVKLNDPDWKTYFNTLWSDATWGKFKPPLSKELKAYLRNKIGKDVTANHWTHALAATTALQSELEFDQMTLKKKPETFQVFAAFAHEVLDSHGRPLVFANASASKEKRPALLYNERMIANGHATPFFMWPNIEPFRRFKVTEAAMSPTDLRKAIARAAKLQAARKLAAQARAKGLGIYEKTDPLQLDAFELRYLARRQAPDRYVIDIGDKAKDTDLLAPDLYFKIANPEDRLFIPAEYVPLFQSKGWT